MILVFQTILQYSLSFLYLIILDPQMLLNRFVPFALLTRQNFPLTFFHLTSAPPLLIHYNYTTKFNHTLTSILDKHAPLKTVTCSSRPHKPFITDDSLLEKSKRSKLESIFRRNKTYIITITIKPKPRLFPNLLPPHDAPIIGTSSPTVLINLNVFGLLWMLFFVA